MRTKLVLVLACGIVAASAAWGAAGAPSPVSPGSADGVALMSGGCPTFLWGGVEGANEYELVVYRVQEAVPEASARPELRVRLPGTAPGWVPSADQCLGVGGRFAWSVRALGEGGEAGEWSEPRLFEVAAGPTVAEVQEAVDLLRRYARSRRDARPTGVEATPEARKRQRRAEASRHTLPSRRMAAGRDAVGRGSARQRDLVPLSSPTLGAISAAAAPSLGAASLTVDQQIHLGAASNVFKEGSVFLWDDSSYNTALGRDALASATGDAISNTASGAEALFSNTSGDFNTASGRSALRQNTTGIHNTASGFLALRSNTTGVNNTATGSSALRDTNGSANTASGGSALRQNTTGNSNTATGNYALLLNTTGSNNTAMGASALRLNTTGQRNVAIGYRAGFNLGYGTMAAGLDDNIFIANEGEAEDADAIRIGTQGTQTQTFIAGVHNASLSGSNEHAVCVDDQGQLGTCSVSSRRFKEEVKDMGEASSGVFALRPVTFRYRAEVKGAPRPVRFGLIAEEVAELYPDLVVYDDEAQPHGVRYQVLIPMLLNELQKQHAEVEALRRRLARLEKKEKRGPQGTVPRESCRGSTFRNATRP